MDIAVTKAITLTHEQNAPMLSEAKKVKIIALAGTGKSTFLRAFSHFNPNLKILYIVFTSENAKQAAGTFPPNVHTSTCHSLAYQVIGKEYSKAGKLGTLNMRSIVDILKITDWRLAGVIRDIINNFTYSTEDLISEVHLPKSIDAIYRINKTKILLMAATVWNSIVDLNSKTPCTHDAYFKIWSLTKPILNYDVILFDEAQDSNNLIMHIIEMQNARLFVVGDKNQQIYSFRGSVNALDHKFLDDAELFSLTQSFRFGIKIANIANIILSMSGETLRVKGIESIASVVSATDEDNPYFEGKPLQKAFIHRTVIATIETAIRFVDTGKLTYWGGKIENYKLSELCDLYYMSINQNNMIKNSFLLRDYKSYDEFVKIAEATNDLEMLRFTQIIKNYSGRLPELIFKLNNQSTNNQSAADYVVTTAHRSKGLEFECVTLNEDFKNPLDNLITQKNNNIKNIPIGDLEAIYREEMNLLYVAVTRAKYRLNINSTVHELIRSAKAAIAQKRKGELNV